MTKQQGKIIVISAPSGCGKSTIINSIIDDEDYNLGFSVSATNRSPRPGEEPGVSYHFMSTDEFRDAVASGSFIEWEEVYPGRFYGTLRSEVDRLLAEGYNVLLDIDVKGALNVKKLYGERALTVFIMPPSVGELRRRLIKRGTDSPDIIDERVGKAEYEMSFANEFDRTLVNDDLEMAVGEVRSLFYDFLKA